MRVVAHSFRTPLSVHIVKKSCQRCNRAGYNWNRLPWNRPVQVSRHKRLRAGSHPPFGASRAGNAGPTDGDEMETAKTSPSVSPGELNLDHFWMPFTANRAFKAAPRFVTGAQGMYVRNERGQDVLDAIAGLW